MHRLEVPWRRAQIYEKTVNLLYAEGERETPDFDDVARRVLNDKRLVSSLAKRQHDAVKQELANFVFAAKKVRQLHDFLSQNPDKADLLYFAITGDRARTSLLKRSVFSLNFLVSRESFVKRFTDYHAISLIGALLKPRAADSEVSALRNELKEKFGVDLDYITALSFAHNVPAVSGSDRDRDERGIAHETSHLLSLVLEAHVPRHPYDDAKKAPSDKPVSVSVLDERSSSKPFTSSRFPILSSFDEFSAYWPEMTPEEWTKLVPDYPHLLPKSMIVLRNARHIMESEKEYDSAGVRNKKAGDYLLENAKDVGEQLGDDLAVVKRLAQGQLLQHDEYERLRATLGEIAVSEYRKFKPELKARLTRIKELQDEHKLSDVFVKSLLKINSRRDTLTLLDSVITVIEHNTRSRKPS